MSGELNITSGGAIHVDSGAFRAVGHRLAALAEHVKDAARVARRAQHTLAQTADRHPATGQIGNCVHRLESQGEKAAKTAQGTLVMADVFELVELRTQQNLMGVGDAREALAIQDRIHELLASNPNIGPAADSLVTRWQNHRFDGLTDQPWDDTYTLARWVGAVLAPTLFGWAALWLGPEPVGSTMGTLRDLAVDVDLGTLPSGTRLTGESQAVTLRTVESRDVKPVAGVRDSIARVPWGRTAQVAVEKYTMKDGSVRYVAYVDGTREMMPGTDEPFDAVSDVELYMGRKKSASYEATLQALEEAGAEPGDTVDMVGYSQGAMIVSHLAMDSPYHVGTVIVAGDPVDPALAADQTIVRLENSADPVNALATGGTAGGSGSPDSFTVQREIPGRSSPIDPHMYGDYMNTGAELDRSSDPRAQALRDKFFHELGEAARVERTEFSAERA
ncbi:hypothetical protein [Microbacterium sp.]|uniref:hypothetical protein n=1 Tax=Microbacterium sp. TaxID=51671 RepID=UPI003A93850D